MKHFEPKPLTYFFLSRATNCPYLEGREEQMIFTDLSTATDPGDLHNHLSLNGFRRSQAIAYKPNCIDCSACVPLRIAVEHNSLSKSQRRISRRSQVLRFREMPAVAIAEHFELFQGYVASRHGDSGMASMSFDEYLAMVQDSPVSTRLIEFRRPDKSLHSVCLTDFMADGFSLVYSFFDIADRNLSPGINIILWHIEEARQRGLRYVYLGYWIAESRKMAYKASFAGAEIYDGYAWVKLSDANPS